MRFVQLVFSAVLMPVFISAQAKEFEIFGTITGDYESKIHLFYDINIDHKDSISAEIKGGRFYFKEKAVLPVLAKFFLGGSSSTVQSVYIDNRKTYISCVNHYRFFKNVNNKNDTSNNIIITKVEGSPTDNLKSTFEKWEKDLNNSGKTIQEKRDAYYSKILALIKEYPKSKAGPYIMGTASNLSFAQLKELKSRTDASLQNTFEMVRVNHLVKIKGRLMENAEGMMFQNFTFKGLKKQDVTTNKFPGKYRLITCWSSGCLSCRSANSALQPLYNKYKKNGFEVIGISFDTDKEAWKDAIKKDKLNWVQLIDTSGVEGQFAKTYDIEITPENFFLDKEGKIIACGLSAAELENRLKRLF